MDVFWIVTLFHYRPSQNELSELENSAVSEYQALGIEEFSLSEPEVDEILGERSYSGGDLPDEVIQEVEGVLLGRSGNYRFFFDQKDFAEGFLQKVKTEVLCESQIEEHKSEDWNAQWKKHYAPIKVSDELEIIPSWNKDYTSHSAHQIYIYPGMGFGTGSHETTFLCLKLFTNHLQSENVKNCLDFGSGSGILGLSVFRFFPDARVDFYDIDPEANKNCFHNAEVNDLEDRSFRLLLPEFRDRLQYGYDVVFANILESILVQEKDSLVDYTRLNGKLILSGLLRHQALGIINLYTKSGFNLIEHLEKGDWAALLFEKVDE